jgi:hypothetical protein
LGFNNEEVDELMEISSERIKGLLWEGVVFSWADLGDETMVEQSLSSCLSQNSNQKSHPCKLHSITQDIKVSGREDEKDDGSVSNARGTGIVP